MESELTTNSFLFQHMIEALKWDKNWTVRMYGVYNDLTEKTINELEKLYKEYKGASK